VYFVAGNQTPKAESAFPRLSQWLNRTFRSIVPKTPHPTAPDYLSFPPVPFWDVILGLPGNLDLRQSAHSMDQPKRMEIAQDVPWLQLLLGRSESRANA
jgi:hypothetical protein